MALGASVANGVGRFDAFNLQHASWGVEQTGNPRGGKADFAEGIGEAIDFCFHEKRIRNFLRLGKENFARAGFSVQSLRLHSAARTLTSKRIADEPTPRNIFFHVFNYFFLHFFA